jgi:hypothetical protein
VFNAALCKPNDADGRHDDQGQRHLKTMTDWRMKLNRSCAVETGRGTDPDQFATRAN